MQTSRLVVLLFLTICWVPVSVATANCTASLPSTIAEVHDALQQLGYQNAAGVLRSDHLPDGNSGSTKDRCVTTCNILGRVLTDQINLRGTSAFNHQQSAYWSSQQAETQPACRVQPRRANDVAATLIITTFFQCPFSVKSGGHAAFAGASNIQDGVTIDLNLLKTLKVSSDKKTTQVGPGNRWGDVYGALDSLKLAVIGGRVADIGVGGLTLGGGISFLSGLHGWACDNVRNYEVVLANGRIENVNAKSNPDLYFALRGGGNNFGIVTRFDLETYEQGGLWGGMSVYPAAVNASIFKAFDNFAKNAPHDPSAALIVALANYQGQYIFSNNFEYAKPVVNPPIFHEFLGIPSISSTLRISNLTDLALELKAASPPGLRETYTTATFKTSTALQAKMLEIFVSEVEGIKDTPGLLPALINQPITEPMISHSGKNGGNALGIAESDGPLILMNLAFMWSSASDDARIFAATDRILDRSIAAAKELHVNYKFLYQNYASARQDVFAGYGRENHERLIEISQKYDPMQVFQRLQPGYFKL